jgi:hypothetical protein
MKAEKGDTFAIARWLIGAPVMVDGKSLGHVIDLEVAPARGFRITALELGRFGWIDRWHLLRPIAHGRSERPVRLVDWADVQRVENGRVICRPGSQVREEVSPEHEEPVHPPRTAPGG